MRKIIKQISGWYFGGFHRRKIRPFTLLRFLLWGLCLFFFISFFHEFWFRLHFPGHFPNLIFILLSSFILPWVVRFTWGLPEPEAKKKDHFSAILSGLDAGLFFDLLLTPLFLKLVVTHPLVLLCCFVPAPAVGIVLFLRHSPRTGNGLQAPLLFLVLELFFVFYFFFWVKVTGLRLSSPGV